jgi:hypothetical protein
VSAHSVDEWVTHSHRCHAVCPSIPSSQLYFDSRVLVPQVGTVILEYITARVVLMLLIINLLSVTLIAQHPSTQKELGLAQLALISETPGGRLGGDTFMAALGAYVRKDKQSAGIGTYYNLDEPLVYLRIGYANSSLLDVYTNHQALREVRLCPATLRSVVKWLLLRCSVRLRRNAREL